jgi:AraC-like DNA-binding protein
MKLYFKCDINQVCKKVLQDEFDKNELSYTSIGFGEAEVEDSIPADKFKQLTDTLANYGIEILESQKSILIQRIKDAIIELVYMEEKLPNSKISTYLVEKLNHSYGYISNLFSDVTFTSIENFIILQKIERAKQLIKTNEYTFTEIAWKLNYSSIAHFSTQFKNVTGLTPTAFQRIMNKRRNIYKEEV